MFYHLLVESSDKDKDGEYKTFFEIDKLSLDEIIDDIVIPHIKEEKIQVDGYFIQHHEVKRVSVQQSLKSASDIALIATKKIPAGIGLMSLITVEDIIKYKRGTEDITKKTFDEANKKLKASTNISNKEKSGNLNKPVLSKNKVFIVHGHDESIKQTTARFIEKLGLEAIILHEQASGGKTIIEKIEEYTNVGYGIVLYTPCDVGAAKGNEYNLNQRARQNVVLEHGFLMGKLGRDNVCALVKSNIEKPSDISGIVYISIDDHGAWKYALAKEMKQSGYEIDMNKI